MKPPEQRLFFALWPPPAIQTALAAWADRLTAAGGAPAHPADVHLTLVFLGDVTQARRDCYEQAAGQIRGAPFELTLDRFGHWSRSGILWAGPSAAPAPLTRLVDDLHAALQACGFTPERRPFAPHLTLRRRARMLPSVPIDPVPSWRPGEFVLAVSQRGPAPRYRILRRWPLVCECALAGS
jgi:2'-5' RNA ligase